MVTGAPAKVKSAPFRADPDPTANCTEPLVLAGLVTTSLSDTVPAASPTLQLATLNATIGYGHIVPNIKAVVLRGTSGAVPSMNWSPVALTCVCQFTALLMTNG